MMLARALSSRLSVFVRRQRALCVRLYHRSHHVSGDGFALFTDAALTASSIRKIVIANRGEIACRIIRTCRAMGIRTVAVFSDIDADAQHVAMSDEAYHIGAAPAAQSYLDANKIIDVATRSHADAIHPGYGFLSENAAFAALCESAGITFIGPPSSAIISMGSKAESKKIMTAANVPVIRGYHGDDQSLERLQREAELVGYPLMIKAVSGGGGKGMRIVATADELKDKLESAKREAASSFKDDRVIIERYIRRPRHIEFQVFADHFGGAVFLFERDCSVQRRHQKVLEEAPAPGMTAALRSEMGAAAVAAAKAVSYVGAGTVEFIVDSERDDEYFFMEMNTRLQVEHPVTEMIVRRDLVQWQILVADKQRLPATQSELRIDGHAIEARIYAENPDAGFLPATGRITHLSTPTESQQVRIESHMRVGDAVSIYYDPLISKLITHAPTRQVALSRMIDALSHYHIGGLTTNIAFLIRAVAHAEFTRGGVTTQFISDQQAHLIRNANAPLTPSDAVAIIIAVCALMTAHNDRAFDRVVSAVNTLADAADSERVVRLKRSSSDVDVTIRVRGDDNGIVMRVGDIAKEFAVAVHATQLNGASSCAVAVSIDGRQYRGAVAFAAAVDGGSLTAFVDGAVANFALAEAAPAFVGGTKASSVIPECTAPMSGRIVKVLVAAGERVESGAGLVILESMKMEHTIRALTAGAVDTVLVAAGQSVAGGQTLLTITAAA